MRAFDSLSTNVDGGMRGMRNAVHLRTAFLFFLFKANTPEISHAVVRLMMNF